MGGLLATQLPDQNRGYAAGNRSRSLESSYACQWLHPSLPARSALSCSTPLGAGLSSPSACLASILQHGRGYLRISVRPNEMKG